MIITLTSDLGIQQYYVAMLKGGILKALPTANIIDVNHAVPPHDIVLGAVFIKNTYNSFPNESVHLLCIDQHYSTNPSFIICHFDDHFFIAPDNGILSVLFPGERLNPFELKSRPNVHFPFLDAVIKALPKINGKVPLNEIGFPLQTICEKFAFQPVTGSEHISGNVQFIDRFGNVITNISKALFRKIGQKRLFSLSLKGHDTIHVISRTYGDAPIGEVVAFFNSSEHLEIAINKGNASELLGIMPDDAIQISFFEEL